MLSSQIDWTRSFPYFIASQPDQALLKIEPSISGVTSEFSILHTLDRAELNPLDTIYVRFPDTIKLPVSLQESSVLINNKRVFKTVVEGQIVAITFRSHAKGWMPLEIKFTTLAGIKTPTSKGLIRLELKIQSDAEYILTNPVEVE